MAAGVGSGGISRGPGEAELRFEHQAQGEPGTSRKLPSGVRPSTEWMPVGTTLGEPEVDPQRATAAGSAGSGAAGDATWRLQLAPHHRAVLQRFFAPGKAR